eukprot:CAMPEP_0118641308 /NCGR_PEP_ID=MMETSP0785-20121206/5211_1 /TAXON_ID=91992 /ORGANISM="Bolidomonas pacifica, Strain CCMP 1866" /LENGTH=52 /DNA_ID=CAMNT_0006532741 /DNA_START=52 /DNA_END=210 /DNA_ORIENTATION=+
MTYIGTNRSTTVDRVGEVAVDIKKRTTGSTTDIVEGMWRGGGEKDIAGQSGG